MAIITKRLSVSGRDHLISPHFKLAEMACRDGTDTVLYSTELMALLERLREAVGGAVVIHSGYRTAAYNKKIGGASLSQHVKGRAADVSVLRDGSVLPAKKLCCLAQTMGFPGVGYISGTALHLDVRPEGLYRGDERKGYGGNVGGDFYRYFGLNESDIAALTAKANPAPAEEKEETDMTQERFNELMEGYLRFRAAAPASAWSESDRRWAEENGLFRGDGAGHFAYRSFCTREELAAVARRLAEREKRD